MLKDFAEVYSQLADYYDRDIRILDDKLQQTDPIETERLRQQKQTQIAARNDLLSKAIPLYEEVLTLNPDNPYAIAGLAKSHLLVGHDQRGLMFARQYLKLTQTQPDRVGGAVPGPREGAAARGHAGAARLLQGQDPHRAREGARRCTSSSRPC